MNQANHEIGEGIFLRFEPDEAREVWSALAELGYRADAEGMKEFVIDSLFETDEPEQKPISPLEELISRHPETVEQVGAAIVNVVKKTVDRFKPRPPPA